MPASQLTKARRAPKFLLKAKKLEAETRENKKGIIKGNRE
jgi:hypothetical protein